MHIPRGHMLFLNHKEYNERKTGGNCMTIKEAAAKTGLTEKTIRYYEAQENRFREKRSVPGID